MEWFHFGAFESQIMTVNVIFYVHRLFCCLVQSLLLACIL